MVCLVFHSAFAEKVINSPCPFTKMFEFYSILWFVLIYAWGE